MRGGDVFRGGGPAGGGTQCGRRKHPGPPLRCFSRKNVRAVFALILAPPWGPTKRGEKNREKPRGGGGGGLDKKGQGQGGPGGAIFWWASFFRVRADFSGLAQPGSWTRFLGFFSYGGAIERRVMTKVCQNKTKKKKNPFSFPWLSFLRSTQRGLSKKGRGPPRGTRGTALIFIKGVFFLLPFWAPPPAPGPYSLGGGLSPGFQGRFFLGPNFRAKKTGGNSEKAAQPKTKSCARKTTPHRKNAKKKKQALEKKKKKKNRVCPIKKRWEGKLLPTFKRAGFPLYKMFCG